MYIKLMMRVICMAWLLCVCLVNPLISVGNLCGDANGDGEANIGDAVYMINYVFKGGPSPDSTCCGPYCPPTVTDIDGNVYQTVQIGYQCWMAENLRVTHYCNGDPIPNITVNSTWAGLSSGAYCDLNNDESYVSTYGRLYNNYAVNDPRGLAPEGWHVPTDAEWQELEMFLGMDWNTANSIGERGDVGGKLKETGTDHWEHPNTGATNETGFTALPGSLRHYNGGFIMDRLGLSALFWTSGVTDGTWGRSLAYGHTLIGREINFEACGFSVRCVKD